MRYGTAVSSDAAAARGAEWAQAEYYRGMLADRLAVIGAELAGRRAHLAMRSRSGDKFALSRLRNQIRMKEAEYRDLVRIVSALERRFVLPGAPVTLEAGLS